MVQDDKPVGLDGLRVEFDDERAVGDAGVMLVATLAQRLGIEALAGDLVCLRARRPGGANVARKVMALVFAMVLGADSIDDTGVLRAEPRPSPLGRRGARGGRRSDVPDALSRAFLLLGLAGCRRAPAADKQMGRLRRSSYESLLAGRSAENTLASLAEVFSFVGRLLDPLRAPVG